MPTVEYQLGQLVEGVSGLRRELQAHHESDMRNFEELFQRIRPLEAAHDIQQHDDEQETEAEHKSHGLIIAGIGAFAAVLGGVGSEILRHFFDFFSQRGH